MKIQETFYRGSKNLSISEAVRSAVTSPQYESGGALASARYELQKTQTLLARLVIVMHESKQLSNDQVLRVLGYGYEEDKTNDE